MALNLEFAPPAIVSFLRWLDRRGFATVDEFYVDRVNQRCEFSDDQTRTVVAVDRGCWTIAMGLTVDDDGLFDPDIWREYFEGELLESPTSLEEQVNFVQDHWDHVRARALSDNHWRQTLQEHNRAWMRRFFDIELPQ